MICGSPRCLLGFITSPLPPPGMTEPLIASTVVRLTVAVIALLGIGIATISVNIAANVVSPANDFANLAPKLISFRTGGLITGVLGVLMLPWKFLSSADTYIVTWLIGVLGAARADRGDHDRRLLGVAENASSRCPSSIGRAENMRA